MHRFLPGILFLQFVTLLVLWFNLAGGSEGGGLTSLIPDTSLLLRVGLPCLLLGVVSALWFASISRHSAERAVTRLKDAHAKEREKMKVQVERDRTKMVEKSQKEINKQTRRVNTKANFKVGLAFAATAVAGVVMIITELITMGLMTMTTAGGALGGYLMRGRQAKSKQMKQADNRNYIESDDFAGGFTDDSGSQEIADGATDNSSSPKLINPPEKS